MQLSLAVAVLYYLHVCLFGTACVLCDCSPVSRLLLMIGQISTCTQTRSVCCAAAVQQAGVDPLLVQEVFMGNVMSAGLGQVRHPSCKHFVKYYQSSLHLCIRALQQQNPSRGHTSTA